MKGCLYTLRSSYYPVVFLHSAGLVSLLIGCVLFPVVVLCAIAFRMCWVIWLCSVPLGGIPLPHLCSLGVFFHWKTPLTASPHKRSFIWFFIILPSFSLFVGAFLFNLFSFAVFVGCVIQAVVFGGVVCSALFGCVLYGACCSRASFFAGVLHYNLLGRVDPCFLILRHYGSPLIFLYHIR